jgi:hypothetical protein
MSESMTKTNPRRWFGVFNPIAHVVTAFASDAEAMPAREALLTGDTMNTRFTSSVVMK